MFSGPQNFSPSEQVEVLNLSGSYHDMGGQYVETLAKKLEIQLALCQSDITPKDPAQKEAFDAVVEKFIKAIKKRYTPEMKEMLQGAYRKAQSLGLELTLDDFYYLDQAYMVAEIATAFDAKEEALDDNDMPRLSGNCSFLGMAFFGGNMIGRNMDWSKRYMRPLTYAPLVTVFEPSNGISKVMCFGHVGGFSNLTLATESGLFLEINSARGSLGNDKSLIDMSRTYSISALLPLMAHASDFNDLRSKLLAMPFDFPFLVNIAGPSQFDLSSIEALPYNKAQGEPNFKNRERGLEAQNTVEPRFDSTITTLCATNMYRLRGWEPHIGGAMTVDTKFFSEQRRLNLALEAVQYKERLYQNPMGIFQWMFQHELGDAESPGATAGMPAKGEYLTNPGSTCLTVLREMRQDSKPEFAVRFQQPKNQPTDGPNQARWTKWKKLKF